jgi:predicted RNA-binding protein with EMAP domain
MKTSDKEQLKAEIDHIFESGANELRIYEMVEKFINKSYSLSLRGEEKAEILRKLNSIKLCLMAHPDNEEDSEFADRISDVEEIENALSKEGEEEKKPLSEDPDECDHYFPMINDEFQHCEFCKEKPQHGRK